MRTRQKRVATDTRRSLGCRTTPLKHWSKRKPTVEPRWAKQQTKKLRPKPTKINSFISGPSFSLTHLLNAHTQPSSGVKYRIFGRTLHLLPYFMWATSKGCGDAARMWRLAWAFASRLCDKYHNIMSWLICNLHTWYMGIYASDKEPYVLLRWVAANTHIHKYETRCDWYF